MLASFKIKTRLISAFLLIGLVPVVLVGYVANKQADKALTKKAYDQLIAVNSLKKNQIENRLARLRRDLLGLANSEFVYEAYMHLLSYHNDPHLGPKNPFSEGYNVATREYKDIWEE